MLIRSQNREILINFNTLAGIEIAEGPIKTIITSYINGCAYLLGEYSNKAKAITVLDMIQKRYIDYQIAHTVSNGLATMSLFVNESDDVDKLYMKAQNSLGEVVVFQMPSDDEVRV